MPLIAVVGVNSYELGGEKDKEVLDKKLLSLEVYERTRQPSYQITNAIMRQTIQPVTEIKLYKVTKAESSEQHYVQTSLDSKAVLQAAGKRKALVGSEYSKYFLMKDEELIPTKEANQITRKEIAEEFQQDGQRLSEHMGNIHQIVAENRRSSHVSGTRHAEEKRRRFMADSNTHKNRVIANPTHYITKLEDHSDTEIAQWALDHTVRLPMKEIEKDLFNLEASCVTEEEPATDSSEEEVEEAGGKKQDKGVSKKYYKRGDEFNILDMDVKGKLEKDITKLDKSLTRDLMKRLQQRDVRAAQTLMYKRQGRKAVTYFGLPNTAGADNADSLPQEGTGKAPIPVFAGKNRRKSSVSVTLREAQFRLENLRRQSAAMNLHNKPTTPIPAAPGRDRVQSPSKTATPTAAVSATPLLASAPPSVPSSAQKTQRSPRAQRHLVSVIPSKSPSRSPTLASSPVDNAASGQLDSVIENQEKGITLSRVSASEVPTTMSADLDGDEDNDEHDDELARLFHTLAADNSDAEDEIVVDAAETDKDDSNLENAEDNADRARRAAIVMRVLDELRNQREKISKSSSVDFTYAVDEKLASIPASTQEPGTMYFVSPIHTVMKKASTSGEARSLRPMPYREREIRSNLKLGSHEVRVKNEEVVRGLNEKEIYPDMTAALMKIDQTSTAVLVTKRARNAIAKDLSVVKEVCHTVSKQCIRETKHLVQVCKRATRANGQRSNDFVQALEEKKFTLALKLDRRRRQLAHFDDSQMQLIDRTIDPSEIRLAQPVGTKEKDNKSGDNKDYIDKCTTRTVSFITQLNNTSQPTTHFIANKSNSSSLYVKSRTSLSAVGRTKNDYHLLYDYNAYFRALSNKNEKAMRKQEQERILSKKWFIQLLKKVKVYKISVSYARVPESLVLLLSAIKKLIAMGIGFSRSSIWLLVDKTIKPEEYKSNLVYTALQCIFDAVNISSEEVYRRWQRKEIDVAPQLLVNVRRARKERRLKVRHAILAMAQIKDRNSSRMKDKVIRAFMSSIKGDRIEEAQDINLQIDSTTDFMKESGNINLASMSSSVYDSSSKRVRSKTESFDFSMVSEEDANEQSNIESAPGDEEEFHNADVDKWLK